MNFCFEAPAETGVAVSPTGCQATSPLADTNPHLGSAQHRFGLPRDQLEVDLLADPGFRGRVHQPVRIRSKVLHHTVCVRPDWRDELQQ
jgi:hypothetical protein